jgi:hypothetical protein
MQGDLAADRDPIRRISHHAVDTVRSEQLTGRDDGDVRNAARYTPGLGYWKIAIQTR